MTGLACGGAHPERRRIAWEAGLVKTALPASGAL